MSRKRLHGRVAFARHSIRCGALCTFVVWWTLCATSSFALVAELDPTSGESSARALRILEPHAGTRSTVATHCRLLSDPIGEPLGWIPYGEDRCGRRLIGGCLIINDGSSNRRSPRPLNPAPAR